jgi:hypothetical protein
MSFGKAAPPGYSSTLASAYTPTKVVENRPDYHITVQIWWAQVWRHFLWGLIPLAIIIGTIGIMFIIAMMSGAKARDTWDSFGPFMAFFLPIVTLGGSIWAWHKSFVAILGKKFLGYRLVLLTPESAGAMDETDS